MDYFVVDVPLVTSPESLRGFFFRNLRSPTYHGDPNVLTRIKYPLNLSSLPQPAQDNVRRTLAVPYDAVMAPLLPSAEIHSMEFGMVNPEVRHQPYLYGYAMAQPNSDSPAPIGDSLVKFDVEGGKLLGTWTEAGCICTEPVFVPRPGSVAEDDGAVLSIVYLADGGLAVVVLDAVKF